MPYSPAVAGMTTEERKAAIQRVAAWQPGSPSRGAPGQWAPSGRIGGPRTGKAGILAAEFGQTRSSTRSGQVLLRGAERICLRRRLG